jgi:scyllo-inositol 2-dehydrogenase (NADP+)
MDLGLASIYAGIPVVIDKPVAISSDQVEQLITASTEANVAISVFQNRRWDNDFLTIKKLIERGQAGKNYPHGVAL